VRRSSVARSIQSSWLALADDSRRPRKAAGPAWPGPAAASTASAQQQNGSRPEQRQRGECSDGSACCNPVPGPASCQAGNRLQAAPQLAVRAVQKEAAARTAELAAAIDHRRAAARTGAVGLLKGSRLSRCVRERTDCCSRRMVGGRTTRLSGRWSRGQLRGLAGTRHRSACSHGLLRLGRLKRRPYHDASRLWQATA
jgi:hypothetical protein